MSKRVVRIVSLAVGVVAVAAATLGLYVAIAYQQHLRHASPMQYYVGLRVYTAQSDVHLYDEMGRLLVTQPVVFPVTMRHNLEDRNVTVVFDRNHLAIQDSLNHSVFQRLLTGAGQVNVNSSWRGDALPPRTTPFPLNESQSFSFGEGVKRPTPHTYTLTISPNYQSRFL